MYEWLGFELDLLHLLTLTYFLLCICGVCLRVSFLITIHAKSQLTIYRYFGTEPGAEGIENGLTVGILRKDKLSKSTATTMQTMDTELMEFS